MIALLTVLLTAGCAGLQKGTPVDALDTSGTTLDQAMSLTLEEQFDLFGQRYDHMQELIRDAQLAVSDEPWYWNGVGILPLGGAMASTVLPGVTNENSYYLNDGRILDVPGLTGDPADLEPMRKYFVAKGWKHGDVTFSSEHSVQAETGDGWVIKYAVQDTGQYYIDVRSGVFWGRGTDLLHAIAQRTTKDLDQQQSLPGVYAPYPKWSDPIVNPPKV
jgi:hypothetical protein